MDTGLSDLGLSPFFSQQLSLEEMEQSRLARVTEVQRSLVIASDGVQERHITLGNNWYQLPAEQRPTVGDWVLLDDSQEKILRLLERKSVFKRVAAGSKVDVQLIAANIDTLFIVSSCNQDFNESRLERYLAMALEAEVDPVVILTKADLAPDAEHYRARAQSLRPGLPVELVNSLDSESLKSIANWISPGSTVALVGSSGVGKSTIVNSLSGEQQADTGGIREQDAKGRHTTSYRALYLLPTGGLLLDVPGMREVKVAQLESALTEVFDDIEKLSQQCRFADCQHHEEPGCAVQRAIEAGILDKRRLLNFNKLLREESRHSASLAEQRQRDRQFSKSVKQHIKGKRHQTGQQ